MSDATTARRIIVNRTVVEDDWQVLRLAEGETPETVALPAGKLIVPLAVWLARREALQASHPDIGVWLDSHEEPGALAQDLGFFKVIAVHFPKFTDGRGYSTARLLRSRYGWGGQLRAIGDVLHDQIFYMKRVGFDAFALKEGKDIDKAAAQAFDTFSECYQTAVDQKQPLFRRRAA